MFERVAAAGARGERHRLAVGEIDVAQEPAGLVRPGQNAERRRIGDHDEVAAALHLFHREAATRREHRIDRPVRGVLGEQRGRHGDAAAHRARRLGCEQGLAAQHAVLVGE